MVAKKSLGEVFKTVVLPPYTYVKPTYYGEIRADISQPCKHLLIEGPSGIGKTCVAFKVFEELQWVQEKNFIYVSCRDADAVRTIDDFLATTQKAATSGRKLIVVDDSTCCRSTSAPHRLAA